MQVNTNERNDQTSQRRIARVAVIGAGWWSQGWHLPQLWRNENSKIVAICDRSEKPTSGMNPDLESLSTLSKRYGNCATYLSLDKLLADAAEPLQLDGVLVCTPHATHYEIGKKIIEECPKKLHILMEKPFTTCIKEAILLHQLASSHSQTYSKAFLINHTANYRFQALEAKKAVRDLGLIGDIRHISAFMGSPLKFLFENPENKDWNEPTGTMLGNGFAWGQSSHILAWIFFVTGMDPMRVFCSMNHNEITGADVSHAATIVCANNANISLSGTTLLPGEAHSHPPVGKLIRIEVFGSKGALIYSGDDTIKTSGQLEIRNPDGSKSAIAQDLGFNFENTVSEGNGPESLKAFLDACRDEDFAIGADSLLGLKTVQTLDAMYRSSISLKSEEVVQV